MNKKLLTAMTIAAMGAALTSCQQEQGGVIGKPDVKVVNGQLTPEILQAFGSVGSPQLSPDGKTILFTLTYTSVEENKSNAEIYSMGVDGSNLTRLTTTALSESNVRWFADGKKIAFIAHDPQSNLPQVFTMNANGTAVLCASQMPNGVLCFEISPDGSKIIMGANIKPYNKNKEVFEGLPKTTGRVVDDLMYKHWDQWVTEIPHPFLADFLNNTVSNPVDIMEGEPFECPMLPFGGAETFAWAPDSQALVYTSRKLTGTQYAFSTDSDLYLYELASKKTTKLTEGEGYDTDPQFSPDGKTLAWLSMKTPKYESDKKRLMVMDLATRQSRDLTEAWDYWPEGFSWSPDSKAILFTGYQDGEEPLFSMNVETAVVTPLSAGAQGYWDYSHPVALSADKAIALRCNYMQPNEIVSVGKGGKVTDLTNVNADLLAQLAPISVEKKMVPTTDGQQMLVWVVLPPGFDSSKQYPSLLYCQGGPQQAVSQFWSTRWNMRLMASNGYVVIMPNRRGVPGFGEEWNRQISGDYFGQNMRDYLSAADYMKQQPYINPDAMGAIGASYGGFSVYNLAGIHEGRFAAFIAHAGIFNLEAQYLETEEMWFADFDMGGAPWDTANATAMNTFVNSPHRNVAKWDTPILVTVGELDYRILASQGMMAFNAAKMRGLEAEMVVFPDENHWILKPQNAILWQRVFFRFLDKHLKK